MAALQNAVNIANQSGPSSPSQLPYTQNPGTVSATAAQAGPASTAGVNNVERATAQTQDLQNANTYSANTATLSENTNAAKQMADITSQKSPLMQLAAQQGLNTAGRRGLLNSSIAAGAAQAEMVKQATPLALQNAQQQYGAEMYNTEAQNKAAEFNANAQNEMSKLKAQLDTSVAQGNAEQANAAQRQLAELQNQVNVTNAQMKNDVAMANAKATNDARVQTMIANADLNKTWLTGQAAMDVQRIQGQYQNIISNNDAAAKLYDSYFNSVSQMLANKDIAPDRAAEYLAVQQSMLTSGLDLISSMNGLNLKTAQPGVSVTGTGQTASIAPTAPATGTVTNTATAGTAPTAQNGGLIPIYSTGPRGGTVISGYRLP